MITCPWWMLALTNLCAFALGAVAVVAVMATAYVRALVRHFREHDAEMARHKKELDESINRGCRQRPRNT
jgi:hypothetical protein